VDGTLAPSVGTTLAAFGVLADFMASSFLSLDAGIASLSESRDQTNARIDRNAGRLSEMLDQTSEMLAGIALEVADIRAKAVVPVNDLRLLEREVGYLANEGRIREIAREEVEKRMAMRSQPLPDSPESGEMPRLLHLRPKWDVGPDSRWNWAEIRRLGNHGLRELLPAGGPLLAVAAERRAAVRCLAVPRQAEIAGDGPALSASGTAACSWVFRQRAAGWLSQRLADRVQATMRRTSAGRRPAVSTGLISNMAHRPP